MRITQEEYPRLHHACWMILQDSDVEVPEIQLPVSREHASQIEEALGTLTPMEFEDFAIGGAHLQKEIAARSVALTLADQVFTAFAERL